MGVYSSLLGILVFLALLRIEWINQKLVDYQWIQEGGQNMIFGAPSWAWAVIFGLSYFSFFILRYAHKLRTQIQETRKEIAQLREEGVKIRNDGLTKFIDPSLLRKWEEDVLDWNERTKKALKKDSEAFSIWFATLDTVPVKPRVFVDPDLPASHLKSLREHDRRLDNLGQMIRDLWGIRDVNR